MKEIMEQLAKNTKGESPAGFHAIQPTQEDAGTGETPSIVYVNPADVSMVAGAE
jgi:hypothetical protein